MHHFKISEELPYRVARFTLRAKKEHKLSTHYPAIVFVTETNIKIALQGSSEGKKIARGQLFLLPPKLVCSICSESPSPITYLEIPDMYFLYMQNFPELHKDKPVKIEQLFYGLEMEDTITNLVQNLTYYLEEKMNTPFLIGIKAMELFVLLKHYYTTDKIHILFSPLISDNYKFALFVLTNYLHVSTSKELAALSNYSPTHFDRLFRKIFNQSPYQWILQKKIHRIYAEVKNTSKPLKLIADQYGFGSVANFGDFCRKHFGEAPSHIRKKIK